MLNKQRQNEEMEDLKMCDQEKILQVSKQLKNPLALNVRESGIQWRRAFESVLFVLRYFNNFKELQHSINVTDSEFGEKSKIKLGFKSRSNCLNLLESQELSSQNQLASVR